MFNLNFSLKKTISSSQVLWKTFTSKVSKEPRIPDNAKCINKVILLGRAVGEAQLKPINNTHFITFVIATNEVRKTKSNELVKRSDFHKVYVYQPFLAQKAHGLITKGTRIYLEGKLNYRKNENQFFSNVIAEKIIFISSTSQNIELENFDDENIIEEINEIESEIDQKSSDQEKTIQIN